LTPKRRRARTVTLPTTGKPKLTSWRESKTAGMSIPTRKKSAKQARRRPRKRRRQRRSLQQTMPPSPRIPAQTLIPKTTAKTIHPKTRKALLLSGPKPLVKLPPPKDGSRLTRRLLPRGQKTTCDLPFAVFLVTSILVKRSCSTRSVRPTCKKARPEVSHNKLVPPTSPSRHFRRRLLSLTRTTNSSSMSPVS